MGLVACHTYSSIVIGGGRSAHALLLCFIVNGVLGASRSGHDRDFVAGGSGRVELGVAGAHDAYLVGAVIGSIGGAALALSIHNNGSACGANLARSQGIHIYFVNGASLTLQRLGVPVVGARTCQTLHFVRVRSVGWACARLCERIKNGSYLTGNWRDWQLAGSRALVVS